MTWREMFLELQLEVEEKIGHAHREAVERINAGQDGAAAAMRPFAEAVGE